MARKGRTSKKLRKSKRGKDNEDRISFLPESILSHILSLLPTKDALRTSMLSREWKNKWTSIYNLSFDDQIRFTERVSRNHKSKFMQSVENVLENLRYSTVKEFKLSCAHKYNATRVKRWISTVLSCNVERFHIWWCGGDLVLPQSFFSSASLTEMVLGSLNFKVPKNICYLNLRILILSDVQLVMSKNFSHSGQLLLTFPVLEVLLCHGSEWVDVEIIKIDAPLLSTFEVISFFNKSIDGLKNCKVEISGGNLSSFFYSGSLLEDFEITNLSKVDFVTLWYVYAKDNDPLWTRKLGFRSSSLLEGFSATVRRLDLSGIFIEALQHGEPPCPLPTFYKVTDLLVNSFWDEYSSVRGGALLELLNKAPELKSLVFHAGLYGNPCQEDASFEGVEIVSATFLSRLTFVGFLYFHGRPAEFQLVQFFLRNAAVLEELVINSERSRIEKVELERQLLMFPKASTHVSITIN